jgi:hypothetical protein
LTPRNASWLNWIECEFTALRYFTLDAGGRQSPLGDLEECERSVGVAGVMS